MKLSPTAQGFVYLYESLSDQLQSRMACGGLSLAKGPHTEIHMHRHLAGTYIDVHTNALTFNTDNPPCLDQHSWGRVCLRACGYARARYEDRRATGFLQWGTRGVRWWRRIYNSWPNRICCCLVGLGMLEKESIYCCQSGGPLAWVGWGGVGRSWGWVVVRWGWGGGVAHWTLEFFFPQSFLRITPGTEAPKHQSLTPPHSPQSHYSHHLWIKLAVFLSQRSDNPSTWAQSLVMPTHMAVHLCFCVCVCDN